MKKLFSLTAKKAIIGIALFCGFDASCKKNDNTHADQNGYIYPETNNPPTGQNAILAYFHSGDGNSKPVSGSPSLTGGAGIANPTQSFGPDNSDVQLLISQDKKYLMAVNLGSNSIAVFNIGSNGSLQAVQGSPFPFGVETLDSPNQSGQFVYAANQANDGIQAASYTALIIGANGAFNIVSGSSFITIPSSSPSQAVLSNDKKLLFGANSHGFIVLSPVETLRSSNVNLNGTISAVAGTPLVIAAKGGALSLWENPMSNVLYVGFLLANQIGI